MKTFKILITLKIKLQRSGCIKLSNETVSGSFSNVNKLYQQQRNATDKALH